MFRLLFGLLMIVQVLACPFLCAPKGDVCQAQQQVVRGGCCCCHAKEAQHAPCKPANLPAESDACQCFCSAEFQHSIEKPLGDLDLSLSTPLLFAVAWQPESPATRDWHMLPDDPGGPPGRQLRVTLQTLLL
jgi:hypothetical protein